tara:strand:+ start:718 stop:1893 length:1176 start_codon:yes stop_codon:yes gene_type:complete
MFKMIKLGDILKTGSGGTPLKSKKEYYENGNISWLQSGAVSQKEITNSKTFITEVGLDNSSAKIFPSNTILVAMYGATAGQVGILRFPSSTNQAVCGIYPSDDYLPEFLYYYLLNYRDKLLLETSGVAQPNLSQIKIKNIEIPIIPIIKQKEIVLKIENAFNQIDKLLTDVAIQIKESKSLINVLTDSKINDLPKTSYKNLGEVSSLIRGPFGGSLKKSIFVEKGFAIYEQVHPIKDQCDVFRYFITENKFHEMQRFEVKPRDLLMSCSGTIGRTTIVPSYAPKGIINQALLKITPSNYLLSNYLQLVMRSGLFQRLIWGLSVGAAQANVPSVKVLKELSLPIPKLEIQKNIVEWKKNLDKLEFPSLYTQKRMQLINLKNSILNNQMQFQD